MYRKEETSLTEPPQSLASRLAAPPVETNVTAMWASIGEGVGGCLSLAVLFTEEFYMYAQHSSGCQVSRFLVVNVITK